MTVTTQQIKAIHARLDNRIKNDKEAKAEFIYQFTGDANRTSTKELTFSEANEVIVSLGGKPYNYDNWALYDNQNTQHRRILSLLWQLKWLSEYKGNTYPDLKRLSEWLKTKAPVKKRLKAMTPKEVSKTIYALENMLDKNLAK